MANDRSRRRVFPASSIVLEKRWQGQRYEQHQNKLREVKGSLDRSPPKEYPHLKHRAKQEQMKQERQAEIDRENKLLLTRLEKLCRGHGQIDNWNRYKHHSLNENQRQIEARREDERTAKLREHVASVKHYYSVKQWVQRSHSMKTSIHQHSELKLYSEKDYDRHRQYLAQMAETTKPYQMSPRKLQYNGRGKWSSENNISSSSRATNADSNISNCGTTPPSGNDVNKTSRDTSSGHVATPVAENDNDESDEFGQDQHRRKQVVH